MSRTGRVIGAVIIAGAFGAAPLAAQRAGSQRLGLGVGLLAPSGDFHVDQAGDGFNMGWQGLLFLQLGSRRGPLGTRLEVSYSQNGVNDHSDAELSAELGQPVDASIHLLTGSFNLTLGSPQTRGTGVYALGGVGLCRATLSAKSGGLTADTTQNAFAWNVGAGVTRGGARIAPFMEARYRHVASVFDGPSLPYFVVSAGMRF
ncbi:MAG TPA: outer membrane beta-barrel protein [Gemmatimonadales bacterium]|nr:outer membrane beta-barrel protein [Gemmatimonadales bacterium]